MRIREILLHNFRSFRGEHRISFVNSATGTVHPLTVLAGPNGSGKTTIFEVIAALLEFTQSSRSAESVAIINEALETGLIALELELYPYDFGDFSTKDMQPQTLFVAAGRRELAPAKPEKDWPNCYYQLAEGTTPENYQWSQSSLKDKLQSAVATLLERNGRMEMTGGYVYFPTDRQLSQVSRGVIEPPTEKRSWVTRYSKTQSWPGSLQQLWVWQNYLDLEQGNGKHKHFRSFVESVESILGNGRTIKIVEGQVTVPTHWYNEKSQPVRVGLNQLPSGEQQILLLFGELARRRRRGVVIGIDEVENSLHPMFQRLVMANLFKVTHEWDAQVIVATHSIDVINAVRGDALVLLEAKGERLTPLVARKQEQVSNGLSQH